MLVVFMPSSQHLQMCKYLHLCRYHDEHHAFPPAPPQSVERSRSCWLLWWREMWALRRAVTVPLPCRCC